MVQKRWIDKVFSLFKQSPWRTPWDGCWDSMNPSEKGARGEQLALNYCKKELGFRFITKNGRSRRGEIDLICLDKGCLVFIEVRLRKETSLVSGVHSISRRKKSILRRTALAYLNRLHKRPKTYRLDIISIAYGPLKNYEISHYRNVALF
jgi:putative endonuclease